MMNRKNILLVCLFACSILFGQAQVLFTYGPHSVTKQEFLKAFNKNNMQEKTSLQTYKEYLDLYIRFKIKVQAAKDKRMDTLANQKAELSAFRSQVVENYINDEETVNLMVEEAFQRSQKEIRLSHILIPVPQNAIEADTVRAKQLINEAYEKLNKGASFQEVALQYSKDPSVNSNKGDMGSITIFVLPYELETLAYTTPVGKYSKPFRSSLGWHIFKKTDEQKSKGKVRVAHILLPFSPDATEAQKATIKKTADSLYEVLTARGDFKALAAAFSGDNFSYQNGGELPEFGVGQFEHEFEQAAFSTPEGQISKAVPTSFGYHIIKVVEKKPVNDDPLNKMAIEQLKQQVLASDRMEVAKKMLVNSISKKVKFRTYPVPEKNFRLLTTAILRSEKIPVFPDLKSSTPLFAFEKQTIRVKDWIRYLQSMGSMEELQEKNRHQLYAEFVETATLEYYKNHLEQFNTEFAYQLKEFKEGNLLFEIMQKNIWENAGSDSSALRNFYTANRNKYWWENSAEALIFTVTSEDVANRLKQQLQQNYRNWKTYIDSSGGTIQGDSGRYELGQIPVVDRTNFNEGLITEPVINETDNSLTFSYIVKLHPDKEMRSFEEARGFVINDYQNFLEDKWIDALKKKYPVKVNEEVLRSLK